MRASRCVQIVGIALIVALSTFAMPAPAQQAGNRGVPNPMQGFSKNRDKPVQIEAATLEVRDKEKVAVFSGNVHVVQGDTELRCKSLVVFYEPDASAAAMTAETKPAAPKTGLNAQQRIRRLEAKGGVTVKQNDQVATGTTGIFDMRANTVTLQGNVVVSHGQNITRGDRLVVNLTTGVSRIESGKTGDGRVRALIQPSSANELKSGNKPTRDARDPVPGMPLRLN